MYSRAELKKHHISRMMTGQVAKADRIYIHIAMQFQDNNWQGEHPALHAVTSDGGQEAPHLLELDALQL